MQHVSDHILFRRYARPLPRPNQRLSRYAAHVAACARPLIGLAGPDATIGVTSEMSRCGDDLLRLTWWDGAMTQIAEVVALSSAFRPEDTSIGALQRAGDALLGYLAGRWPAEASPPALGVVTDGYGVAFSPRFPSPRAPGWLAMHGGGLARPLTIVPFPALGGSPFSALELEPVEPATLH